MEWLSTCSSVDCLEAAPLPGRRWALRDTAVPGEIIYCTDAALAYLAAARIAGRLTHPERAEAQAA